MTRASRRLGSIGMVETCTYLLCAACLFPCSFVHGDDIVSRVFHTGGPLGEVGVAVQPAGDGTYLVAGYAYSEGSKDWAGLLMLVDRDGRERWRRLDDGPGQDFLWSLRSVAGNGFIVAGTTSRDAAGGRDIVLERLGNDGKEVWRKTFGGNRDDVGWSVQVVSDGGFAIAGQTESEGAGGLDAYLIRTDANGNMLWSRTFGTAKTDRVFSLEATDDNGYILAGMTGSERNMDMMLVRTDANGKELWTWTFGGEGFDVAHDVKRHPDGGFLVIGYTDSFGQGSHDACLARVSAKGRLLWMRTIGGAADERTLHAHPGEDGSHVLVGYAQKPETMNGDFDLLAMAVDRDGMLLWRRPFGGSGFEQGKGIMRTDDGLFVLVGGTQSLAEGPEDILLIEIDDSRREKR